MNITVSLDVTTTELAEQGEGRTWPATKFSFNSQLPESLWIEPFTGQLMLKPAVFFRNYQYATGITSETRIRLSHLLYQQDFWEEIEDWVDVIDEAKSEARRIVTLYQAGSPTTLIELLIQLAIITIAQTAYIDALLTPRWVLASKDPLGMNQGVGIQVANIGLPKDRRSAVVMLKVGQWGLVIGHDYSLELHKYIQASNTWEFRERFQLGLSGRNDDRSLQIVMLPVQPDKLIFYYDYMNRNVEKGLFEPVRSYSPYTHRHMCCYTVPEADRVWMPSLRTWEITKSDVFYVGIVPGYHYDMVIDKIVFPTGSYSVLTKPYQLWETHSQTPTVERWGHTPLGTTYTTSVRTPADAAFTPATDRDACVKVTLARSSARPYWSPQVQGVSIKWPAVTDTITRTDRAVTAWQDMRISWHLDPSPSTCEFGVRDPDKELTTYWYAASMPVRVKSGSTTIFEGYTRSPEVHGLERAAGGARLQLVAEDQWSFMEQVTADNIGALDGVSHIDAVRRILNYAGVPNTKIAIGTYEQWDWYKLPSGNTDTDFAWNVKEGSTVAEVLRQILDLTGWVLWLDGDTWRYEMLRKPDPTLEIEYTHAMFTKRSTMASHSLPAANKVAIFNWMAYVDPPAFNVLEVRGTTKAGPGAKQVRVFWINEDSWKTPGSADYIGRVQHVCQVSPYITSDEAGSIWAKRLAEEFGHARQRLLLKGEWKAGFKPNTVVRFYDDSGAVADYRIEQVHLQVTKNVEGLYAAEYELVKVGEVET